MKVLAALIIAFLIIGCKNNSSIHKELDEIFGPYFKTEEPGGAVLIARDGEIVYQKGFGIADLQTKEKITTKTLFNTGSISKTFVAFGILKLAQEGKLSLEDDLNKYFTDFKDSSIAKKIKIYHLLTHTSGLPDNRKVSEDSVFYLTAKDEENFAPVKQNDSLHFEPGEQFEYSNPAFNGLALIIEKITGQKWQDYISRNIFNPAGMTTSTITDGPHPQTGVSHGYLYSGDKFVEKDYGEEPTFAASGNGGIWSSVEELWLYEKAIKQYKFLDSAWIQQSRKVFLLDNWKGSEPSALGLCWFITKDSLTDFVGHTGSQGGFRADYIWIPGKKIFYVILCNTPKPLMEIRNNLFDYLSQNNWLKD